MPINFKKVLFEFFGALSFSMVGFLGSLAISHYASRLNLDINLGGDKANVFLALFLFVPLGSLSGILIVDKLFFNLKGYNILGLCLGFLLCFFLGGLGGVIILDKLGGRSVFFLPIFIIVISFIGYYIPSILRRF